MKNLKVSFKVSWFLYTDKSIKFAYIFKKEETQLKTLAVKCPGEIFEVN